MKRGNSNGSMLNRTGLRDKLVVLIGVDLVSMVKARLLIPRERQTQSVSLTSTKMR